MTLSRDFTAAEAGQELWHALFEQEAIFSQRMRVFWEVLKHCTRCLLALEISGEAASASSNP